MVLAKLPEKVDPNAYVKSNISPALTPALVELCREKPADPLTFLANKLLELNPAADKPPTPAAEGLSASDALDQDSICKPQLAIARRPSSRSLASAAAPLRPTNTLASRRSCARSRRAILSRRAIRR